MKRRSRALAIVVFVVAFGSCLEALGQEMVLYPVSYMKRVIANQKPFIGVNLFALYSHFIPRTGTSFLGKTPQACSESHTMVFKPMRNRATRPTVLLNRMKGPFRF